MMGCQHYFIQALLAKTIEPDIFVFHADLDARIEVYRRNFMQGYTRALRKTFSITAKYLGSRFEELAVSYVCNNRPKAGQLFTTYGNTFPQCLDDLIAQDLARLEWDLQTILIGPEDVPYISNVSENADELRWQLRSDVILFQSKYSIGQVYAEMLQGNDYIELLSVNPSYYLLYRCGENPVIVPLTEHEHMALSQLSTPHTIGELIDRLTFSKEVFASLLAKVFNTNFLKVAHVNDSFNAAVCSSL